MRGIIRTAFIAVAVSVLAVTSGHMALAQQPAPLDACAALPAMEFVSVSPSGARLASIKVEGEKRGLLVTGEPAGLADVSSAKVRDMAWIGRRATGPGRALRRSC